MVFQGLSQVSFEVFQDVAVVYCCLFVCLKDNNGGCSSLDVVPMSFLMVVTSHYLLDFCGRSILSFGVFAIICTLSSVCP